MTIPLSVADRMQTMITAWEGTADRRAIFLSCYALMTRNMLLAIERGEFEDGAWVSALLHRFAGYYFSAVEAYDERERCTAVRHFTFEAAREPATHVLQNLILGVNAHINYDLVLALVDLLQEEWAGLPPARREQRYQDHHRVNAIIAGTINSVQEQVIERYDPAIDMVDRLLGPLDEWLIARLIAGWRDEVWQHASELLACPDDGAATAVRQEVELQALARARAIAGKRARRSEG